MKKATTVQRVFSRLIDITIFTLIGWMIYKMRFLRGEIPSNFLGELNGFLTMVYLFLYYPLMESIGGTIGKQLTGIKTVSVVNKGEPTILQGYKKAIIITLPMLLCVVIMVLLLSFGISWAIALEVLAILSMIQGLWGAILPFIISKSGLRFHDNFAKVDVISRG